MQKMREGKITALSEVKGALLSVLMFYLGAVLAKTRSHFIISEKVMKIVQSNFMNKYQGLTDEQWAILEPFPASEASSVRGRHILFMMTALYRTASCGYCALVPPGLTCRRDSRLHQPAVADSASGAKRAYSEKSPRHSPVTLKSVGRIHRQTFVDTCSRWAAGKLYTTKTPITGAGLLNGRVLPFFSSREMGLIRILTGRGAEYCGKLEQHDYELYPDVNGTGHIKTKARHPQANDICERFHKNGAARVLSDCLPAQAVSLSWRSCRSIWTSWMDAATRKERIKEKCAAAERPCRHSLTERGPG